MKLLTNKLTTAVHTALAVGAFALAGSAFAQDAPAGADQAAPEQAKTLQAVTVTGTRIRSVDFETAQPIVVLDRAAIQRQGFNSVADILQNLPEAGTPPISRSSVLASGEDVGGRQHGEQALFKGAFGNGGRYTVLFDSHALRADDPQGLTAAQLHGDRRAASQGALAFDTRKTVRQQQSGVHVEKTLSDHHAIELTLFDGRRDTTQMLSIPVFVQANPLQGGGAISLDRAYHGADIRWRWTACSRPSGSGA